jgi:WD40 repeat protein
MQNAAIANVAQAANTQEVAQRNLAQAASTQANAQRDLAQQAEATAVNLQAQSEREARVARSREWASLAINNFDSDPERSVLLAMQAVSETYATDGTVLPEAADALHRSIQASPLRLSLPNALHPMMGALFNPDGTRIVTTRLDNEIKVWDAANGQELFTLPKKAGLIAINPDGRRLGFIDSDAQGLTIITTWEVSGSMTAAQQVLTTTLPIDKRDVNATGFSPDWKRIILGHYSGAATVWDMITGQQVLTLTGHTGMLWGVIYSPDGKRIATASEDNTVKIWDATTGQELFTLSGHRLGVFVSNFSPDGKHLVTCGWDGTARVWRLDDNISGDASATREEFTLATHLAPVAYTEFSRDGKRIVTASFDGTAKIWDAATGAELLTLHNEEGGYVFGASFSPDGQRLATAQFDGNVRVWDTMTGQKLLTIQSSYFYTALRAGFRKVRFTSDGQQLVAVGGFGTRIWDLAPGLPNAESRLRFSVFDNGFNHFGLSADGQRLAIIDQGTSETTVIKMFDLTPGVVAGKRALPLIVLPASFPPTNRAGDFSPDLAQVALGHPDGTVDVLDIATAQKLFTLSGPEALVGVVRISPDGTRLAIGGQDGTLAVFDLKTRQELFRVTGHTARILGVDFSNDSARLATASENGLAKVWDAATGRELLTLSHVSKALGGGSSLIAINEAAFSPDGKYIATAGLDHWVKVWDADTGKELYTLSGHTNAVSGVAFSPDGKYIASAGDDGYVKVWDLTPQREVNTWDGHFIAASQDQRQIVTLSGITETIVSVLDVSTDDASRVIQQVILPLSPGRIGSTALNADWSQLVTGLTDGTVKIWNLQTGQELLSFTGHSNIVGHNSPFIESVALSPDGTHLATGSDDGTAKLWSLAPSSAGDAVTSQLLYTVTANNRAINIVAFSPDGKRVATGNGTGESQIRIWDVATGQLLSQMYGGHTSSIYSLAFNADWTRLASGSRDNTAIIWDVATGQALFHLTSHTNGISGLAFSADGLRLATGSADGTAKIWDATTGEELQTISGDPQGISGVLFSPDGKRLMANNNDGTIRVYLLNTDDLLALAHSRVTRSLTTEECQQYLHLEGCP